MKKKTAQQCLSCIIIKDFSIVSNGLSVVYGYGQSHISGGAMRWSNGSDVTGSDVSHVTCTEVCFAHAQPEVAPYPPSGDFWPEVTVTWPEEILSGCDTDRKYVLRMTGFSPRVFFLVVVTWLPDVTEGHSTPSVFPWKCACVTGSCTTPVVTEGHVTLWKCPWCVLYDVHVL